MTNYVLDSEPDDDDSDDESRPKHEIPYWAQRMCLVYDSLNYYQNRATKIYIKIYFPFHFTAHVRKVQLAMQRHIPEEIVYKFFDSRKGTPNLTEMFPGIDKNRLKRTSSAIWKTPPRISMMEIE